MSWRRIFTWKAAGATLATTTLIVIPSTVIAYKYGQRTILQAPPEELFPHSSTTKLSDLQPPRYCRDLSRVIPEFTQLGLEVVNTKPEIDHHTGNDFTTHKPLPGEVPQYIIYPKSTAQVSQILQICHRESIPVLPFSGGSSLEGHIHSTRQNLVIDTSKMSSILAINDDDLDVVVQSGVNWMDLNQALQPRGLMFGPDCGPQGLISGMIATNASGINASRYGAMSANVISVTAVLADGTVVKTRQRPRKSSAGYNLTNLFVGSEGTLGIVTEAVCKVYPIPKSETTVVVQFPSIAHATNAVAQVFKSGMQPNAVELLDGDMMHCLNYSGYTTNAWLEVPTIFFKIGGISDVVVEENIKVLNQCAKDNQGQSFIFAKNKQEQEELFSARKNAFFAMINWGKNEIDEDVRIWVTDIAVPLSRLSSVLDQINDRIQKSPFASIILAHAADGNSHVDIFYKHEQRAQVELLVNEMIELGLANEGTATGEHGVGNAKRRFLESELGADTIGMMRKLKMSLDPKRILNPDKIFKIDPDDDYEY
ncbi:uncharacterized protein LODBEIA_P32640 [Lodderomyces beijingensis]|uniref:FAD-binding PCMH-type domain-containing protein n=1 Tax=Lodderomyces beijingensis TaxID=1775926 RepID=A0ABP0ZLL2_9ASCO